ncbi:MAG: response regulator receiver [Pedobacter sp.]|jgi:DNA-binding response OmpR family regulator|nr:response regulator receiver [Pedobacter sp.]
MRNKILIIDDDSAILDILTECFTEQGYEVKAIAHVNDIYELIDSFQPNVVLTDYILDGINGGEFCTQIKMAYQNLPVVILSAYPKVMLSLGTYNCDLFVPKPFDIFGLIKQVNNLACTKQPLYLSAQPA